MIAASADRSRRRTGGRRLPSPAAIALAFVGVVAVSTLFAVALRGPQPQRSLEDRVRAVASSLRCPVCQSLSVADSPSGVAREMRATIARRLRAGDSPDEIRRGFVDSYGDSILLAPPRSGIGWLAWILPPIVLIVGAFAAVRSARRWVRRRGAEARPDEDLSPEDARLLRRAMAKEGDGA